MDQLGCSSKLSGGQRWLFDNTHKVVAKASKGSYWDRKPSSEGRMAGDSGVVTRVVRLRAQVLNTQLGP